MFKFKAQNSFAKRSAEARKMSKKWTGRIPVIMEKSPSSRIPDIPKNRFLCPAEYTVQQFLASIRYKLDLPKDRAMFVFVNGRELLPAEMLMSALFEQKKDEDGFLYILYSDQEVMGS